MNDDDETERFLLDDIMKMNAQESIKKEKNKNEQDINNGQNQTAQLTNDQNKIYTIRARYLSLSLFAAGVAPRALLFVSLLRLLRFTRSVRFFFTAITSVFLKNLNSYTINVFGSVGSLQEFVAELSACCIDLEHWNSRRRSHPHMFCSSVRSHDRHTHTHTHAIDGMRRGTNDFLFSILVCSSF